MKILAGIEQPTTGELELDGEPVELRSPRDAADRGIVIIHQELSLFPNLSVADNLFMARESCGAASWSTTAPSARRPSAMLQRLRGAARPAHARRATCGSASSRSSRSPGRWRRTRAC